VAKTSSIRLGAPLRSAPVSEAAETDFETAMANPLAWGEPAPAPAADGGARAPVAAPDSRWGFRFLEGQGRLRERMVGRARPEPVRRRG